MTDSIHQLLSLPPRHLDGLRVDAHDCLREVVAYDCLIDDRHCLKWAVRDVESCSSLCNETDWIERGAPLAEATPGLIDMEKYGNDATLTCGRTRGHEG